MSSPVARLGGLVIGVLLLLALGFGAGSFLVRTLTATRGGDEILLAMPQRSGEYDLNLLKWGEEIASAQFLFQDVLDPSGASVFLGFREEPQPATTVAHPFGGFLPGTDRLLLYYLEDDGEVVFQSFRIGDEAPQQLFSSDAFPINAMHHEAGHLFLTERRAGQNRCYVATTAGRARRVGRASQCQITLDGERVVLGNVLDGDTTLTIVDKNGENEVVILDEVDDVHSYQASYNGAAIAYLQSRSPFEQQIQIVDVNARSVAPFGSEAFTAHHYGFLPQSVVPYALLENDDGELELYVGARSQPVVVSPGLEMIVGEDDTRLYYMTVDESEFSIYAYDVARETSTEVLTEDYSLSFTYAPYAQRLLILHRDEDEFTLFTANRNGGDLLEIFSDDRISHASFLQNTAGTHLYLMLYTESGERSLFATPFDKAEGSYVLERWNEITLLNHSAGSDRLLLWGIEDRGDRGVLLATDLGEAGAPVQLDDGAEEYRNAVFTPNGREVLFTAVTGDRPRDVEVLRVPADGSAPAERLYDEAILADTRWTPLYPFDFIGTRSARASVSLCPGAPILTSGVATRGVVPPGGQLCYRLHGVSAAALELALQPSANDNFALSLYDEDGDIVAETGFRSAPRIATFVPYDGAYYLEVTPLSSAQARFTLTMEQQP